MDRAHVRGVFVGAMGLFAALAGACVPRGGRLSHAPGARGFVAEPGGAGFVARGEGGWSARVAGGAVAFAPRGGGSALALRTSAIGRGVAVAVGEGDARAGADGVVRLARSRGVREELRADAAGVEQSWRFDARPEGAGGLLVRVEATGERLVGRDGDGALEFEGERGGRVRYGRATWVDARGERTDVAVRARGDALELLVPGDVVDRSSYPAVLDPVIGDDTPLESGWPGPQLAPAIAHGGGGYAVAWTTIDPADGGTGMNIRATGFSTAGARIMSSGTSSDIRSLHYNQNQPAIAWTGSQYLVVWRETNGNSIAGAPTVPQGGAMIAGAYFNPSSTAPVAPFVVCDTAMNESHPSLACNTATGQCLAVWDESTTDAAPGTLQGASIDTRSTLPPYPGPCTAAFGNTRSRRQPDVAFGGGMFAVVWRESDASSGTTSADIDAVLFASPDVGAAPAITLSAAAIESVPKVASDGTDFYVVWSQRVSGNFDVYGRLLPGSGATPPAPIAIATAPGEQVGPDVAFDGTNWFVGWTDTPAGTATDAGVGSRVGWARVTRMGGRIDPPAGLTGLPSPAAQYGVALASDGLGINALAFDGPVMMPTGDHVWVALLGEVLPGGTCSQNSDCAVGLCVAGTCTIPAIPDAGLPDVIVPADVPTLEASVDDVATGQDAAASDVAAQGDGGGASSDGGAVVPPGATPYGFHGGACECAAAPGAATRGARGGALVLGAAAALLASRRRRRRAV